MGPRPLKPATRKTHMDATMSAAQMATLTSHAANRAKRFPMRQA